MKVREEGNTFLGLKGEYGSLEKAEVVILSAPYECTSSYGRGSTKGPEAILNASIQLEEFDEEISEEVFRLCNGIATLEPMSFGGVQGEAAVTLIEKEVRALLEKDKFVVSLCGEHTGALGPMRAYHERSAGSLSVLQLDAHSDLRDSYLGDPYSHAAGMARALEFIPSLVQMGIRARSREDVVPEEKGRVTTFYAHPIKTGSLPDWQDRVLAALSDTVYLTIDCDFFDPSLVPSVGTPEPGGFLWYESLEFLRRLCSEKKVVGFDVCEFSPIEGLIHPDFALARLVYKLIGYIWTGRP